MTFLITKQLAFASCKCSCQLLMTANETKCEITHMGHFVLFLIGYKDSKKFILSTPPMEALYLWISSGNSVSTCFDESLHCLMFEGCPTPTKVDAMLTTLLSCQRTTVASPSSITSASKLPRPPPSSCPNGADGPDSKCLQFSKEPN